jgi:hypothetical protein
MRIQADGIFGKDRMIANIASDDVLILPHHPNPAGLNFRERQQSVEQAATILEGRAPGQPCNSSPHVSVQAPGDFDCALKTAYGCRSECETGKHR